MRVVTAADINGVMRFSDLIDALDDAFRSEIVVPLRHHHPMPKAGEPDAMLLLMPAWTAPEVVPAYLGTKLVTVYPGNSARNKPSIFGGYMLADGTTGEQLAMMDGTTLTAWRTAAASALAGRYLARMDAKTHVMVGAGALSPMLIKAYATVRPIERVIVWNRSPAGAEKIVQSLQAEGHKAEITVANSLEEAVRAADIISCATISTTPLVKGEWLKEGAHLDLVGAYTPAMRESDDDCVKRASLFVDTRNGALKEGGDIADPLKRGLIKESDVRADLFDLCRGVHNGRTSDREITLFKSVGTAIEDLAAAVLVWNRLRT